MQPVDIKKIYRIIDANFNRAKEGLRVCEDVARFLYDDPRLTRKYKDLRHDLDKAIGKFKLSDRLKSRSVQTDVGKKSTETEFARRKLNDVFFANNQRVKESVRVLEECAKLFNKRSAQNFKEIRYKVYALESKSAR